MIRWKAGSLHLAISVALVGSGLLGLLLLWVPPALWSLVAPKGPLLLLFFAVVLAGPLLTLLVYRAGKPNLRWDLLLIVVIQVAFLGYALYMIGRSRPVYIVAAVDRLQLVFASDIDREDLAEAKLTDHDLAWTGPRLVGVRMQVGAASTDFLLSGLAGQDAPLRPALYVPYAEAAPELLRHATPVEALIARSPRDREYIARALADMRRNASQVRFVPITSRHDAATMLIDAADGTVLRALPLDPWPAEANAARIVHRLPRPAANAFHHTSATRRP